jgi:hypothetical protein
MRAHAATPQYGSTCECRCGECPASIPSHDCAARSHAASGIPPWPRIDPQVNRQTTTHISDECSHDNATIQSTRVRVHPSSQCDEFHHAIAVSVDPQLATSRPTHSPARRAGEAAARQPCLRASLSQAKGRQWLRLQEHLLKSAPVMVWCGVRASQRTERYAGTAPTSSKGTWAEPLALSGKAVASAFTTRINSQSNAISNSSSSNLPKAQQCR